jgi:nuclear transport factor 2 (NTF2) superfamily protein
MRPAVRFADIEVHEQRGNWFRAHAAEFMGQSTCMLFN